MHVLSILETKNMVIYYNYGQRYFIRNLNTRRIHVTTSEDLQWRIFRVSRSQVASR